MAACPNMASARDLAHAIADARGDIGGGRSARGLHLAQRPFQPVCGGVHHAPIFLEPCGAIIERMRQHRAGRRLVDERIAAPEGVLCPALLADLLEGTLGRECRFTVGTTASIRC